ncbi:hypothetical protein KAFR_0D00500 [Kazachstania africana CBS 2517]|uniref:Amino acid permease/ SLC12A domain-containing protein n=1 Tax=Kazachstania africana (strain ATCC 22294 / BCRC 22015 / CBS 2517 / CECT 1963 / NBRC 1671 / NRRL Y-8276) TaxID=1071382 RepID=H2ATJ7_KAZAF|nr:hypothetical protein KAFR_0D00500 [Kazachstania africana CBS 2517]CCF57697.1 hypothetical protein KAFR_0D00500 [Kazachstania africana CBS 2517]
MRDLENNKFTTNNYTEKSDSIDPIEQGDSDLQVTVLDEEKSEFSNGLRGRFDEFIDSFRRAEDVRILPNEMNPILSHESVFDTAVVEISAVDNQINEKLKKTIQPRHVIMITLGTGVGTGLLVGNGTTLSHAGPAGLIIGYAIMSTCIYCVMQAVGEMAVNYLTLIGGFSAYPGFLIDPGLNFAVSWIYCIQWFCVCPLELVTASMTIQYWTTKVNADIFVLIFYLLMIGINIFGGARGYAEAEFFCNVCKILMMTGFFILGIILICGGAGNSGFIGARYWHSPGAFRGDNGINRFKGIVSTLVTAAFAFGGTEFLAITASEQANPRKAIPSAAKKVIYRALIIYVGSIIIVGFLVPYNSSELLGSSGPATKASPYVIAVASHGIRVVPHFINAVILISVFSVADSAFYSSSRLLLTLARQGFAPKIFTYVDKRGRPTLGFVVGAIIAIISFCACSSKEADVFNWLLSISGLSEVFTWAIISLSHIRFRRAMKVQGRSLDEIGFKSQAGVWGSVYAFVMMILVLIGQFWVGIVPVGEDSADAVSFFQAYLAMPVFIVLYFGYKIWNRDWRLFIRAKNIDLIAHRHIYDPELLRQERKEMRERARNAPLWRKIYNFWC